MGERFIKFLPPFNFSARFHNAMPGGKWPRWFCGSPQSHNNRAIYSAFLMPIEAKSGREGQESGWRSWLSLTWRIDGQTDRQEASRACHAMPGRPKTTSCDLFICAVLCCQQRRRKCIIPNVGRADCRTKTRNWVESWNSWIHIIWQTVDYFFGDTISHGLLKSRASTKSI